MASLVCHIGVSQSVANLDGNKKYNANVVCEGHEGDQNMCFIFFFVVGGFKNQRSAGPKDFAKRWKSAEPPPVDSSKVIWDSCAGVAE
jgi:hypothetical protein